MSEMFRRKAQVLASLAICCAATVPRAERLPAQTPSSLPISIQIEAPARVGLPIWVHADLSGDLTARYPFGEDLRYFGSNRLELRRDGQSLAPERGIGGTGLQGIVKGSIALPSSPQNRLPLHLGFAIDKPGRYSVRWTVVSAKAGLTPASRDDILAESNWLDFDVVSATPAEREAWLTASLAAPPADTGLYIGDYLPSLLAAISDRRVAEAVIDATYSPARLISSCALRTTMLLPVAVITPLVMERLHRRGPNSDLAYLVSWGATLFQDHRDDIVANAVSFLRSSDDTSVEGALQMLAFARGFDWPSGSTALRAADRAVLAESPALMARSDRVVHVLAQLLGAIGDKRASDLLRQIIAEHPSEREQATIALRWIAEAAHPRPPTSRVDSPLGAAVVKLRSDRASDRRAAAQALLDLASHHPELMADVGAALLDDVIRRPTEVNASAWRDAALILGRLRHRFTTVLTLYLERDGAAAALIDYGLPAVPALDDILKVGGPARRRLAAEVLGAIGGDAAREALSAALIVEHDAGVKKAIQTALRHLGEKPPRGY